MRANDTSTYAPYIGVSPTKVNPGGLTSSLISWIQEELPHQYQQKSP